MTRSSTLQDLVRILSGQGEREAVLSFHKDSFETWSFAKLGDAVDRLTAGMHRAGICSGARVAIYSPNRVEWIIACLALLNTGAVPVPIDSQMAGDDLSYVLGDSGARWVLTIRLLADRLAELSLSHGLSIILMDTGEEDVRSWKHLLSEPARDLVKARPDDPALLFYTSGVSGRPKGVPLTHHNLQSNLQALVQVGVYQSDERLLLPLPLHHVYPFMVGFLAPLAQGCPIILPHSLTGPQMLRALRDGRATAIVGVPRLYSVLYDAIEQRVRVQGAIVSAVFGVMLKLSVLLIRHCAIELGPRLFRSLRARFAPHLRTMVYGGSPLPSELAWKLAGLGWKIAGGYGLTETSPILTFFAPGDRRFDSAGRALPGIRLRVAEQDPVTGHGEIQAQGENVFGGYWHLPDKTAEAFTEDGWFRTGDLGYLDKVGSLHLVGRASSRITLPGGEKIWPERVEEALDAAASIREAGVFARNGHLVAIIVPSALPAIPEAGKAVMPSIRADVEARLRLVPSYCRITDFVLSPDPLPRTRLGKIQRHKLKEIFETGKRHGAFIPREAHPISVEMMTPEDRQLLEDPVAIHTWEWLRRRFFAVRLTPDTNMWLELGLDSLDWMTMTLELRDQIGVDLHEEIITRISTVRDLLREVVEAEQARGLRIDPLTQLKNPEMLLDPYQRHWLSSKGLFLQKLGSALLFVAGGLIRTFFNFEVRGLDRIPRKGPWVMTPNHLSLLDPAAIIAALPVSLLRGACWGGWTGIMFKNPIMRLVSRATSVLPVDQHGPAVANLALGVAALARGNNLIWFPEGNRSPDGRLQTFQPGIGLILTACPVPVIPVRIEGTFEALPRGSWWPRRGRITVQFGRAFEADELAGDSKGPARYRRISQTLQRHVAALAEPSPSGS